MKKQDWLLDKIEKFLATNPSEAEGDLFYINEILPYDKRSITEILNDRKVG